MKFIPKLWAERADQKHDNNRSRLVSAPGANYYIKWLSNFKCLAAKHATFTWKKTTRVTETTDKNNLRSTRANFKQI